MEQLKQRMHDSLQELQSIISEIQESNLQNEQFCLDFVDEINKLSVSF